ncbi:class I tRNA ligase family protein, partial [candidate division WWE3 bacterium]|nr:class I tRNA ligase family protein [candidate division WWE3 bacterium]
EVHHPNEIAQSEAATGVKFVSTWLHGAFLLINDMKVSKSKNNYVVVQDIVDKGINPIALRYFFMSTHYRKQTNFTWEALKSAETSLYRLYAALAKLPEAPTYPDKSVSQTFTELLADDLRLPEALALLWSVVDNDLDAPVKLATLLKMDTVFGFDLKQVWMNFQKIPAEIKEQIQEREKLRQEKEYGKADHIRDALLEKGYRIEDTENGPVAIPVRF